jgi:hypothetical protein
LRTIPGTKIRGSVIHFISFFEMDYAFSHHLKSFHFLDLMGGPSGLAGRPQSDHAAVEKAAEGCMHDYGACCSKIK